MSNPNALFLLADHVKLSLLERKRAQALDLESDSQDGHISRSLEQFRDGLEALRAEQTRLEEAGEERYVDHSIARFRHASPGQTHPGPMRSMTDELPPRRTAKLHP